MARDAPGVELKESPRSERNFTQMQQRSQPFERRRLDL
jgi:hypothetical protein